jgi:DNA-binding GntR family transcriptional regulator
VKLAIAHGNAAWEDEIITSFHVLEHMFLRIRASKLPDVDEFEARHHRFHRALIAACPLRAITDFCEQLYMQATRYRVLLRRYAFTPESLVAEHRILMRVVLDRRKSKAAEALRAHIGITADVLRGEFTDWPAGAAVKQDAAVAGAVVRAGAKTVVKHRRRTK